MRTGHLKTDKYKIEVDGKACKECGYCTEVCPKGIFVPADYFNDRGYKPVLAVNNEACVGCLKCFYVCPDFAINVKRVKGVEKNEKII